MPLNDSRTKGFGMFLDCLRIGVAFGSTALFVGFWYWLMDSMGTF